MTGSAARLYDRAPTERESQVLGYLYNHPDARPARITVDLGMPTGGYILMLLVRLKRRGLIEFAPHASPPRLTHRGLETVKGALAIVVSLDLPTSLQNGPMLEGRSRASD